MRDLKLKLASVGILMIISIFPLNLIGTGPSVTKTQVYVPVKNALDGEWTVTNARKLYIYYYEDYEVTTNTVQVVVFSDQTTPLATFNVNVQQGSNEIVIDLASTSTFPSNNFYWLRLTNQKSEKKFLRFQIP